jgi:hypothetical protein
MSRSNTAPTAPPLAKNGSHDQSNVIIAPAIRTFVPAQHFPSVVVNIASGDFFAHSPPILALICARLI